MQSEEWAEKIQQLQQRVEQLQRRAGQALTVSDALEEVATALEELSVTQEELLQQNEELVESRRELEAERQHYQELFEFAPDGYLVTGVAGEIQAANRAAATLLNVPQSLLSGKPLSLYVATSEREAFRTRLNQLLAGELMEAWETRLQPRNGAPFVASLTAAVAHNPAGQAVSVRWLVRDITAHKRLDEALQRSEERYRHLIGGWRTNANSNSFNQIGAFPLAS